MAQITIYVDDDTEARMRAAAKEAGVSLSGWIAGLVRARTSRAWPDDVRAMAGDWGGTAEDPRVQRGEDVPREPL